MTLPKMDTRIGLDYIVENREYISKLGAALDTNNTTVKKQIFELLSALCAYNAEGYSRTIETLDHYKNLKNERYRFRVVVNELEKTTVVEYQVALLAFVNCVIISALSLQDRLRIRNEFIGLGILPILTNLRRVAHSVGDIIVQLDVFDEQRECDEAQSLQTPNGINLSSHLDVFYAILRQVANTQQETPFLSILQHLLSIDSKEAISDIIWDTAERLVHRATLLENTEDSARLLRSPSVQKFTCPHCRVDVTSPGRKQSVIPTTPTSVHIIPSALQQIAPPPPPPPPAPPNIAITSTPPPPPPPIPSLAPPPPPPMSGKGMSGGAPPAPPPPSSRLLVENSNRPKTPEPNFKEAIKLLPQQETPTPNSKMRTINWNKIPPNKVVGTNNIWTIVAKNHQNSPMTYLDWSEMEGLFCLPASTQGSPKLNRDSGSDTVDRRTKKENPEILLLDGKRSLNVNIFLKQFRTTNEDIIQLIKDGEHDDIGAEKLRGLLKILPEIDEVDMLKSFNDDKSRLGSAEKFLLQLIQVPNYKLRIESMLLKEEFAANVSYLEPCINAMLYAGTDLIDNKMLQEVLYMVVVTGNFLNAGGYAGNAAGVKLTSLQKLTDIRANKPGMNLIHFVALQLEKRNPELLNFADQMTSLENASKTTPEQINNEMNTLNSRIKKIKKQIELETTDPDIKAQMVEFIQDAERDVAILQSAMKEVELMKVKLAEFFCEDVSTFKVEECFKIFYNFCEKFKQAVKENDKRRILEEQAIIRRKQREEQIARRARQLSQCGTPVSDPENSLLLDPQIDIRCSPALSRRRLGSFNNSADPNFIRDDEISPNITPNGSLRRRRSRVLNDDEDGLMDFLRSSGHDNNTRERKTSSYGSLDRSWARRARTGSSSKKRPELLNIDFGADRERPCSPSLPIVEPQQTGPTVEEAKPRISKEWRQKIESWLQANENDDKQNEDYKRRRRLTSNRRSLENESESERGKLDPLPEEKSTGTGNDYKRVYPDWKPSTTIEKTDVVGTIEAIEDAQNYTKDKSAWRKSNLNVPNSSEFVETEDRRTKRQKPWEGSSPSSSSSPLHSITEEDRRKTVLKLGERDATDRLHLYIRRPSETDDIDNKKISNEKIRDRSHSHESQVTSPTTRNSDTKMRAEERYSKIEIDSDNIETPPVVRRALASPTSRKLQIPRPLQKNSSNETNEIGSNQQLEEVLGNGNFDRFSAARKTRRYKRPTDYSSGNEDISPTSMETVSIESDNTPSAVSKIDTHSKQPTRAEEKEERLKRWQERLKTLDKTQANNECNRAVTKLEKAGRHFSSINQEDVREAIRNLKSPTGTPERIWSPPRELIKEKPSIKISNHELNDEGFEETQSLVSDTPSHGKESTSSCNEQGEQKVKRTKPMRMTSTDSAATTSSDASKPKTALRSQFHSFLERSRQNFERSRSMRTPVSAGSSPQSVIPKRAGSLRKTESQSNPSPGRRDVERSSSRTSLRSSRSSLNSAVSTNTVRKMPISNKAQKTSSAESSPSKRPLATQNSSIASRTTISRVPASRSSSSGSSIGPSARRPPLKTTSLGSTSFKENRKQSIPMESPSHKQSSAPATTRSNLLSSSRTNLSSASSNSLHRNSSKSSSSSVVPQSSRISGFMRPTASSVTKRQQSDSKSSSK